MVRRAGVSGSSCRESVPEEWDWERGRRLRDHGERLAAEIVGLLEREEELHLLREVQAGAACARCTRPLAAAADGG